MLDQAVIDAVLVTKVDPPQVWSGCVRPGSRRCRASFNVRPSAYMGTALLGQAAGGVVVGRP